MRHGLLVAFCIAITATCGALAWKMVHTIEVVAKRRCDPATSRELSSLPVITVSDDEILFNGALIAMTESVRDDAPTFKIEALTERLDSTPGCAKGRVCLERLAILELDALTHARVLPKIINSTTAAGYEVIVKLRDHAERTSW